jgi:membrane protein
MIFQKQVDKLIRISRKIVLPGFDGVPLYDVLSFFIKGIYEGFITARASAISFNFFLAIFPTLILFITVIPLFIDQAQVMSSLLSLLQDFIPGKAYESVVKTIEDVVTQPHAGWFSVSFLLTLYFSTNSVYSLMEAFNNTYHSIETRSWIKLRLVSLMLVLVFTLLIVVAIGLITFGTAILQWILPNSMLDRGFYYFLLVLIKWMIVALSLFFAISFLYYMAPAGKREFRFISAGSTLATFLVIMTTLWFNFYFDNFSRYNILYGSIGTLMVVLLWIWFNAISILIGFELNASIYNAKLEKKNISGTGAPSARGSALSGKQSTPGPR